MELFFRGKLLNLDQFRYNSKTVNTLLNYRVLIPKTSYRVTEKTLHLTALIPGESLFNSHASTTVACLSVL